MPFLPKKVKKLVKKAGRHFSFLKKAGRHQKWAGCRTLQNGLGRTLYKGTIPPVT